VSGTAGNAQVAVTWTAPASNGGSPITEYTVTAAPGGQQCTTVGTIGCTVLGLTNGIAYTFTVIATNAVGDGPASTPSGQITPNVAATPPGAPTGVSGTAGNAQVAVTWTAPASNGGSPITDYTVTAAPGGQQCTTAGTIGCTVLGLTNGIAYTFTVIATNAVGDGPASTPSGQITPRTTPGAPTNLVATPGNAQVGLAWDAPASNGGGAITVYTATSSPGGVQCVTTGATSCVVNGLTNGITYTFTVVATNVVGNSPPSATSNAVTPDSTLSLTQCGPGKAGPFPDVPGTHLFCPEIEWLVNEVITAGYPDGTYRPTVAVARQSMAAFLYRHAGQPAFIPPLFPSFTDVPSTYLFYLSIEWLAQSGVTGGYPDGTFKPTLEINRAQMAVFLYRFAGEPVFTAPAVPSFTDVPTTHVFYKQVEWLASTGITGGFNDGTFKPANPVTRQSMAAFLKRFSDLGLA
jgi:hypothetical protein